MRRLLNWVFIKPFHHAFYLTKAIPRNAFKIFKAGARGASRNIHRYAPLSPGISSREVRHMDRWWRSLSGGEREALYSQYRDWVISHNILAERTMETRRGVRSGRIWTLTGSPEKRAKALPRQRGMFRLWSSIWLAGVGIMILMGFINTPGLLYYIMFLAFIAFVTPDVLSHRIALAQLLYGRRVTLRELVKPLPKELSVDPDYEARYKKQFAQVLEQGVAPVSPVQKAYRKGALGWTDEEASL